LSSAELGGAGLGSAPFLSVSPAGLTAMRPLPGEKARTS
jgi:hypothetical protein